MHQRDECLAYHCYANRSQPFLGAGFINFARGPIVVTDDLLAGLDTGHLKHAVLYVFDTEPLPAESPLWGIRR
jgi:phosphoglycerate dehydrogenase-like enzyme